MNKTESKNYYKSFKFDTNEDGFLWETIVDFTDIKREGIRLENLLLYFQ